MHPFLGALRLDGFWPACNRRLLGAQPARTGHKLFPIGGPRVGPILERILWLVGAGWTRTVDVSVRPSNHAQIKSLTRPMKVATVSFGRVWGGGAEAGRIKRGSAPSGRSGGGEPTIVPFSFRILVPGRPPATITGMPVCS